MNKLAAITAITLATTLAHAGTAFLKGERVSGMNKICFYDDLGSTLAITINSYEVCPVILKTRGRYE